MKNSETKTCRNCEYLNDLRSAGPYVLCDKCKEFVSRSNTCSDWKSKES